MGSMEASNAVSDDESGSNGDNEDPSDEQLLAGDESPQAESPHTATVQDGCNPIFARRFCVLLGSAGVTLLLGILELHYSSYEYDFVTGMYFLTQIVTTVGYGDIGIRSQQARLVMSAYILWLLVLVAYVLNAVMERLMSRQSERLKRKLRNAEEFLMRYERLGFLRRFAAMSSPRHAIQVERKFAWLNDVLWASMCFGCHILFGTVFCSWYERCSCSYGKTIIEGCDDEHPCSTGGATKDWIKAFYMSVVTLTTVGFGDVTPLSWLGRLIGIPWMISGILSAARFVEAIQQAFFIMEDRRTLNSGALAEHLDAQGRDVINKVEFLSFVLVHNNLVDQETIDRIIGIYDKFDTDKDDVVTKQEIKAFLQAFREGTDASAARCCTLRE
mmetsp:Transcript_117292/g.230076  ORF Transcript_117292/g.230076 Transcript_117292/m.230076 type:complete len:387 (-) Transcript_117292:121-1281(-)